MIYDATCYYGDEEVGNCTIADADFFELVMSEGTAKDVLVKYAYFSTEIKAILDRCVEMESEDPSVIGTARIEVWF